MPATSSSAPDHQILFMSEIGMRRHHQAGFTLAELVVVILILGILAAVLLPRFFQVQDYEAQGTYDRVLATVRYAQKAAIGARCNVRVTFAGNAVSAAFETVAPCTGPVLDPVRGGALGVAATSGVSVTGTTFVFDPLGRPTPGPVTVNVAGKTFTVEAETGHVHP